MMKKNRKIMTEQTFMAYLDMLENEKLGKLGENFIKMTRKEYAQLIDDIVRDKFEKLLPMVLPEDYNMR